MVVSGASAISSIQNAAIMPRVQATAPRRAFVTSASCFEHRNRITLDVTSYSSNTDISRARNSRLWRVGSEAMCALISAPINVSSGDGGGISSASEGGNPARSVIKLTPHFSTPQQIIGRRNSGEDKAVFHINHERLTDFQTQRADLPVSAVGPTVEADPLRLASGRADPFPHKEKAGSTRPSLFPILRGQPSQGCRRVSVLRQGYAFAALSPSHVFAPADLHAPRKVDVKNLAHVARSKCAPRLEASQ